LNKKISIFWFRRDLRLDDNCGLFHALNNDHPVLPIFIYDQNIISKLKENDHRLFYINQSIEKMNVVLQKNNKSIHCLEGKPIDIFSELIKKYRINKVYTNRDYTPYSKKRDTSISKFLIDNNIEFIDFKDHVLFEKNEITKDDGSPYRVYTPYSKKWIKKMNELGIQEYNSEKLIDNFIDVNTITFSSKTNLIRSNINFLKTNISEKIIENYESTRNFPSLDATSKAGVKLRFGTISTRKLIQKASQSNNNTYLKELIWREFFSTNFISFSRYNN